MTEYVEKICPECKQGADWNGEWIDTEIVVSKHSPHPAVQCPNCQKVFDLTISPHYRYFLFE